MQRVTLGIDIGGTNTEFGLVDIDGKILDFGKVPTKSCNEFEKYLELLYSEVKSHFNDDLDIIGIGIGAPNANYYNGTIEHAPNLFWKGIVPIKAKFEEKFNIPVVVTNDANAAAIGEMVFGGAKNMKNFVVITLGTGVGSGIVVNGELVYGHDGFAGEIGHSIVIPDGRLCACGRKGCIEAYACASGVVKTAKEFISKDQNSSKLERIDSRAIAEAAESGDKLALEVFEYTGKMLGLKLSDTVAHLSPEAVFIFGGVAKAGKILLQPTQKYLDHFSLNILKGKTKILPSQIPGDKAAVIGASALAWNEFHKH